MDVFKNAFSETPEKVVVPPDDKAEAEAAPEVEKVETEEPAETSSAQEEKTEVKAEEAEKPEPSNRDDSGRFVKTVPHEALHAERKRREAVENELAQLREAQKKPPTSVLENEDLAFQERLSEYTRPLAQRLLNMSIAAAKRSHEDYQDVYDFMDQEVRSHPELMQAINDADDPGEYIYQLGKTRKELAEVGGDFTKLREQAAANERTKRVKVEAENKALKAELDALKSSKEKREAIPQSLHGEQSGSVKDEVFKGPTPLRDVLPKI